MEMGPKPKKVVILKKNYNDPTYGLIYSLGCSLVHFALLVSVFFVEMPDIEKAKEFYEKQNEED